MRAFIEPLQRSLSCITTSTLAVSPAAMRRPRRAPHLTDCCSNRGQPVALRGAQRVQLDVQMEYVVVATDDPDRGPYKVSTRGYRYHILTADGTESFLYHWHPSGRSPHTRPHAHIGNALLVPDAVITRKEHVPTGRVALEHVIQFLLQAYEVVPSRQDYERILEDSLARFERWRTWS